MDSKSAFTLLFLLSCASSILQIGGKQPSQHVDNANKREGGFIPGQGSSNSPGNSSISIGASSQIYSHLASYSLTGTDSKLHGVRAKITVWKIAEVQPLSSSLAYIAAHNSGDNGEEKIIAGVHVDPGLYNNYDLRFFTYWSSGIKGCFNLNCSGFVVADGTNLHPGQALAPLSTYGGPEKYFTIRIKKDQNTGDWSLYREDQGGPIGGMTLLGWWPKTLFTSLSYHATLVEWTGAVFHHETERSPPMGSGHFSSELNGKAASFKQIFAFNLRGGVFDPEPYEVTPYMDREDCYTVSPLYHTEHSDGSHFFYGGPGGCSEKKLRYF